MYVYVQKNPNWISYSYGGLFRLGYYILNLRIFESSRIISRWGCAPVSTYLPDSATCGHFLSHECTDTELIGSILGVFVRLCMLYPS